MILLLPFDRMPFHVYILRCADNSLYVGYAEDVTVRLATHNSGRAAEWTSDRRPVELVC